MHDEDDAYNRPEGIHDPEWDRYLVARDGKALPVGDPTRWGAQVYTRITGVGTDQPSTQVLQMASNDQYSRSWAVLGTLSLPPDIWLAGAVSISLEVSMGVGQAVVTHRISLFEGTPIGGLCHWQYFPQGGPYLAVPTPSLSENPAVAFDLTRGFAAIGALVGQSINIRARYVINSASLQLPARSLLVLAVTPFAAGKGL